MKTIWIILRKKRGIIFSLFLMIGIFLSCENLEIENFQDPSTSDILTSPDDVKNLVQESFLHYWQAIKGYNVAMTAHVMADHTTSSWGGLGMAGKFRRTKA